jgi:hypothetical protein
LNWGKIDHGPLTMDDVELSIVDRPTSELEVPA